MERGDGMIVICFVFLLLLLLFCLIRCNFFFSLDMIFIFLINLGDYYYFFVTFFLKSFNLWCLLHPPDNSCGGKSLNSYIGP